MTAEIDHVIFDIGNVLVDWNPRNLYGKMFDDDEALAAFLRDIIPMSWHGELDAGKPFAVGVAERIALFPQHAELIHAWDERWPETIGGPIEGSVAIMRELKAAGISVLGITNYNREKFDGERKRFEFYDWFDDLVVSGDVGMLKPDRRIYELLITRNALDPARAIFIDDRLENVRGAEAVGLRGHHFRDADALRSELKSLGLPV